MSINIGDNNNIENSNFDNSKKPDKSERNLFEKIIDVVLNILNFFNVFN